MFSRNLNKRFSFILLVIFVASVFVLIGCGEKEPKVIKIGAILPLTGNLAWLGEGERNALLIAEEDINSSATGTKVDVIFGDSKGEGKEAVSLANKMINIDKTQALITSLSAVSFAVQPIAEQNKILQFVVSIHPDIATKSPFTFRIYPSIQLETKVMVDYAKRRGFKKVAILFIGTPESERHATEFLKPELEKIGIQVVAAERFSFADRDLTAQILRIKNASPDSIIIIAFSHQHVMVFKGLAQYGILKNVSILGDLNFSFKSQVPVDYLEGVAFVGPSLLAAGPNVRAFQDRYEKRFGTKPNYDPFFVYDILKVAYDALSKSKGNVEEARKNLVGLKGVEGLIGKIDVDENGDATIPMQIFVFRQGKAEAIGSSEKKDTHVQ